MKRLLMVAYHFPPDEGVGRMRTLKFCKYLRQFGWQPVVLTHEPKLHMGPDPHGEIPPETEVHRIGLDRFHPWLVKTAAELRSAASRTKHLLKKGSAQEKHPESRGTSGLDILARGSTLSLLLRTLTYWPDRQSTWIPPAIRKALALARSCDALYSTGNPWSDHVVAAYVKKFTRLPWIMDFRDPWMQGGVQEYPFVLQRWLFTRWERKWVTMAERVLQVTDPLTEVYRAAYPDQPQGKFLTLANGFDEDDFTNLPSPQPQYPMTMTYLGSLTSDRKPTAIIEGIRILKQRGLIGKGEIRVRFIGSGADAFAREIDKAGVTEFFDLKSRLDYAAALKELGRSHIALLIGGPKFENVAIPTKFYEYLAARRYILAVVPNGHMADKLISVGVPCADCNDAEGAARIVLDALIVFRKQQHLDPPAPLPEMAQYTRRYLTERLAEMLDKIHAERFHHAG